MNMKKIYLKIIKFNNPYTMFYNLFSYVFFIYNLFSLLNNLFLSETSPVEY